MAVIVTSYGKLAARTLRYPKAAKPCNSLSNPRVLRSTAVNASLEGIERVMAGLRRKHNSRGAQTYQTIVSFSKAEFDAADPADQDRAMQLLVGIAEDALPPGTPSAIYLQADGKTGCLHGHIVSCTTLPRDCELNGTIWRAGRKLGGDWTEIGAYRKRCNAAMERRGFINELQDTHNHDVRLTKHESGISHRQRDFDKRAAEGVLEPGEQRPEPSWRMQLVALIDRALDDPRAVSWDGLEEVLGEQGAAFNFRTTRTGATSVAWRAPGRKSVIRGTTLGAYFTYDAITDVLAQHAAGVPRRRLRPRQSETRPDKVSAQPSQDQVATAHAAMVVMADVERAQQHAESLQAWLNSRVAKEPESTAEALWQSYGEGFLDEEDWDQLHRQWDDWRAKQDAHRAAAPQRIAADEAARRARLTPQERRVDQLAIELGLPHDDAVWDELMATVGRLNSAMLADDAVTMDDWVDAHFDDLDLDAVRRRAGLPEAAAARTSGSADADQTGRVQTAGISAQGPSDDSPEPLQRAPWPFSGHEADTERPEQGQAEATQEDGGLESAENASPAMGSTRSTTSTADGAQSWPNRGHEVDILRPQTGHDMARWPTSLDADAATENPSAPAPVAPSTDAPALVSVENQTGPAFAPAAASPSSAAPALDGTSSTEQDRPADAPALAADGLPSAPAPVQPYRSGVRSLRSRDEKAQQAFEAIARFDEAARLTLAEGGRIPTGDVPRGIGPRWLATYGDRLDPVVRYELRLRAERMAERRTAFESGKQLKDELDALGRRGDVVTDEYRDTEARLSASNAQRRLIEDRMRVGIYEAGSTWRPGRPVPPRTISASMQQQLHELADAALDDHHSVEAPDPQPGS